MNENATSTDRLRRVRQIIHKYASTDNGKVIDDDDDLDLQYRGLLT